MTGVFIIGKFGHRQAHKDHVKIPPLTSNNNRSIDWSDAAVTQGTRTAGHHEKVGRGKEGPYLEFQRKHGPTKL